MAGAAGLSSYNQRSDRGEREAGEKGHRPRTSSEHEGLRGAEKEKYAVMRVYGSFVQKGGVREVSLGGLLGVVGR